ncbi:MAG: polysaccharide deacetylase family protein [Pseudobdellovibrio sp.]
MNILHLLSQNHLTGSEVYAAQLIQEQNHSGKNKVYQISNDFFIESMATSRHKIAVETKSKIQFWKSVLWIRKFIINNNIHIIHTHSRASAKMAYWARVGLKVGLVSTIHGRQHKSLSKKIWNHYGDFMISVCKNIQSQLVADFNLPERRMLVIPNPICQNEFKFLKENSNFSTEKKIKIAVVGRTTGPKGLRTELILKALPDFLKAKNISADYFLVGDSNANLKIDAALNLKQIKIDKLASSDYAHYDLVIGSGRVAIESLITGVPTLCFGEACYLGLARLTNLDQFMLSNFGDIDLKIHLPVLNPNQLTLDLEQLFSTDFNFNERKEISKKIENEFNSIKIAKQIQRIYESSYFLRNYSKWIPILMYHKIPDEKLNSQHKIFVTAKDFKKHLHFFKSNNFETLTFSDLKKFQSAEVDFTKFPKKPLILTFDDGYTDNLTNASPLLKQFGFKAQLFLLADKTIASNTWDHSETETPDSIIANVDRQKWLNSAFEIGSHGFNHQKITTMTTEKARDELRLSKANLESEFKTDILVYAFTYGDTNIECARLAYDEGYDFAVNTDSGGLLLEENPFQIFRVNIFPNETMGSLWKKTSSWYRRYYCWKRKK